MLEDLYNQGVLASRMPSEVSNFTAPEELIFSPGGEIPLRNIFSNQKYSKRELEKLDRLKALISKSQLELPEDCDDAFLLRIIHGSGYKTDKAFKDLKESLAMISTRVPSDYKILFPKAFSILVRSI
jgi:hypothetical protein